MRQTMIGLLVSLSTVCTQAQRATKNRLDFATTYIETGGTGLPGFTGKQLENGQVTEVHQAASAIHYLNWGGFHFWGHAELYVSIPLSYQPFRKNESTQVNFRHSVTTGARFFPWACEERKPRPYVGMSWSALEFQQLTAPENNPPVLSKDFLPVLDAGLLYGYRGFWFRLGIHYFPDNEWQYPLSKTVKETIKTPPFGIQVGLMYAMDFSKKQPPEVAEAWNSYPRWSKQQLGAERFGTLFLGAGPSISYTLRPSDYNRSQLPYLQDQLTSSNYFDMAVGYHFEKWGMFAALSFRNPKYKTEGFGDRQVIRKTSLAFELTKFLFDYTGFTPYVGLNVAYDRLHYSEQIDGQERSQLITRPAEPGVTFGWDIQPGKNNEALILRTNLRWYPFSTFEIDGKAMHFSQLEYNLIQVVFYPERWKSRSINRKSAVLKPVGKPN